MELLFAGAGWLQRELLLFCGVWFAIGAIDDLMVDIVWLLRRGWRHLRFYRHNPAMQAEALPATAPDAPPIAVFVAAWDEAGVIAKMLRETQARWRGERYRLYLGCYPNDPATIDEARDVSITYPELTIIIHDCDGPTTKADCLNQLWRALRRDTVGGNFAPSAVVLHDAEDLVAPASLRVYAHLLPRADFIQLPVVPLPVPGSHWISAHYCDEFAEAHGKQMVVREAIGAGLPAAGVGCAISFPILARIAERREGLPFDPASLTEDYEIGLSVTELGGRAMLVRIRDADGHLVATRAHFPADLHSSVRQKSRWMAGIALAGWDRMGWGGSIAENWMRLHDRRAPFSAVVLGAAYAAVIVTGIVMIGQAIGYSAAKPLGFWLSLLLWSNGAVLLWRLAVRAAFVFVEYGWRQALMSVPRAFVSNVIALLAARRAIGLYVRHCLGTTMIWDKTAHRFPVTAEPAPRLP